MHHNCTHLQSTDRTDKLSRTEPNNCLLSSCAVKTCLFPELLPSLNQQKTTSLSLANSLKDVLCSASPVIILSWNAQLWCSQAHSDPATTRPREPAMQKSGSEPTSFKQKIKKMNRIYNTTSLPFLSTYFKAYCRSHVSRVFV